MNGFHERDIEMAIKRQTHTNPYTCSNTDGSSQTEGRALEEERGWVGKGGKERQTWSQSHQMSPPPERTGTSLCNC